MGRFTDTFKEYNSYMDYCEVEGTTFHLNRKKIQDDNFRLRYVKVPEGVTQIDRYGFDSCSNLEVIELPSTLKELPAYCFRFCYSLRKVNIPEGITKIPFACFSQCQNLSHIDIPESVTWIAYAGFSQCFMLSDLKLPSKLQYIEESVFSGCSALKKLEIPSSIKEIKNNAFEGCTCDLFVHKGFVAVHENFESYWLKWYRGKFVEFDDMRLTRKSSDDVWTKTRLDGKTPVEESFQTIFNQRNYVDNILKNLKAVPKEDNKYYQDIKIILDQYSDDALADQVEKVLKERHPQDKLTQEDYISYIYMSILTGNKNLYSAFLPLLVRDTDVFKLTDDVGKQFAYYLKNLQPDPNFKI